MTGNAIVSVNDRESFDSIWRPHEEDASRELGSVGDALHTLVELNSEIAHGRFTGHERHLRRRCCDSGWCIDIIDLIKLLVARTDLLVGDTDDVHVIIPPRHRIGYVICESKDGRFALEKIEGLDRGFHVLREKGRMIAVMPIIIGRSESMGNVHVA